MRTLGQRARICPTTRAISSTAPRAGVDVRLAQLRHQQMIAAENIEWKIAITVVVAVEEPPFLLAVQRIVGGVEIEDDLLRRALVSLEKQINQQRFHRRAVVTDLVIEARRRLRPLQTIERRLAGHRRAIGATRPQLARQRREQRVMPQRVVIDEVFVSRRQAENPLAHQRGDRVLDQRRMAPVDETARDPLDQPDRPVDAPQQQRPGVGSHRPAVETGHHFPLFDGCEFKSRRATVRWRRGIPGNRITVCGKTVFADSQPRCT